MSKKGNARGGLQDQDVRRLLGDKSPSELAGFLLKGLKENKAFRRKVLAWLIDTEAEKLPKDAVLGEIGAWIEDIFDQRSVKPRTPNLKDLNPIKSAVKNHPDLAVPAYLAIVDEIAAFLDAYGGGPISFYDALGNSFHQAAANLPMVADSDLQREYLGRMERFEGRSSDFGYGLDCETAEVLEGLHERLASGALGAGRRRRR